MQDRYTSLAPPHLAEHIETDIHAQTLTRRHRHRHRHRPSSRAGLFLEPILLSNPHLPELASAFNVNLRALKTRRDVLHPCCLLHPIYSKNVVDLGQISCKAQDQHYSDWLRTASQRDLSEDVTFCQDILNKVPWVQFQFKKI